MPIIGGGDDGEYSGLIDIEERKEKTGEERRGEERRGEERKKRKWKEKKSTRRAVPVPAIHNNICT